MKRLTFIATISSLAVAAAAPALAGPGGGHGGGMAGGIGNTVRGTIGGAGPMGTTVRDSVRVNSQGTVNANPRAIERANSNSVLSGEAATGTRVPDSALRTRGSADGGAKARISTKSGAKSTASTMGNVTFGSDINGHAVVDSSGTTIGTVTGVSTKGNGSVRTVQVTLNNGQIITLAPNSLSLNGDVLTTTSTATNVNSQGAAHANVNGLIHASPNSALASAGVTSLTGLDTGLTVNTSGGTLVGTVDSVITNRSGAVVAIRVALDGGGTATIPATTLSMDGSTVVTSSTQF